MKIAIDCADLDNKRIDGTRVYLKNVLNWLGKIDAMDEFFLYHRKDFNPQLKPKFFENYTEKKIPYKFWWTQTRFAYELLQERPDVLWMPIQQMPYLLNKKIKTVVTIHDLAFKIFPDHFTRRDKFKLNLFTDFAVKNADKIIAVSESTKHDILKFYPKIDPDKIKVIYHGADIGKSQMANNKSQTKSKLQILNTTSYKLQATSYLLYLGAIQPRKDLITLVRAFEIFKDENRSELKLIIAGAPAWQSEKILERIKNSKFSKDIILPGQVSFEERNILYRNAKIFIFPSLYEGFGIPVLEAWENETPVIVADNSSLKEIGGDAVLKFETKDSQDLKEKIEKILKDDKIRMDLVKKGKERLNQFSWKKCAKETLASLK